MEKQNQQSQEERRAWNMVWNASGDYSFRPEFKAFDEDGKAELYWNCILGAARRHYDYPALERLFRSFEGEVDQYLYQNLLWLGLENCTYERERAERPVLGELRKSLAERIADQSAQPDGGLAGRIQTAHFQRVLGLAPSLSDQETALLNGLEFDASLTAEEIAERTVRLFRDFLGYLPPAGGTGGKPRAPSSLRRSLRLKIPIGHRFQFGVPQPEGDGRRPPGSRLLALLLRYTQSRERGLRRQMEENFGISSLGEFQTAELEHLLCEGNHKDCRLHFTRGEYPSEADRGKAAYQRRYALRQEERNRAYYRDHLAEHQSSIARLTDRIQNALQNAFSSLPVRAKSGALEAGRIYRALYLNDNRIFRKELPDLPNPLTVDLLLDASASQLDRQERVAAQGYILAESLTRCRIPVRVSSYCSLDRYTVIRLFRDYGETKKNGAILGYFAAGFNRDGLALRAALQEMAPPNGGTRILIVLSDSRPNDMHRMPAGGAFPSYRDYSEDAAVRDTAREVFRARKSGVTVLCVFTGEGGDLSAAKQIYGSGLARIPSPERFADTVGILLQNLLRNL